MVLPICFELMRWFSFFFYVTLLTFEELRTSDDERLFAYICQQS
jgi:hypothetical protein